MTEPSGLAAPVTETGAPGLRPASPEVGVTVAFGTAQVRALFVDGKAVYNDPLY